MKADRQSRVWPYLGLLACLFALSVTAPAAWREAALRHRQSEGTAPSNKRHAATAATSSHLAAHQNSTEVGESHTGQTRSESPVQGSRDQKVSTSVESLSDVSATVVSHSESESETVSDSPRTSIQLTDPSDRLAMRFPTMDATPSESTSAARTATENAFDHTVEGRYQSGSEQRHLDSASASEPKYEDATSGESYADAGNSDAPLDLGPPPTEHLLTAERKKREIADIELALPEEPEIEVQEELSAELAAPGEPTSDSDLEPEAEAEAEIALPQSEKQEEPARTLDNASPENGTPDNTTLDTETAEEDSAPRVEPETTHRWAMPGELLQQLKTVEEFPLADVWVADTRMLLDKLCGSRLPDADTRAELLAELQKGLKFLKQMAAHEQEWAIKAKLLRVQYAFARRLDLWQAMDALGAPPMTVVSDDPETSSRLARRLSEFSAIAKGRQQGEAWRRHLRIEDLQLSIREGDDPAEHRQSLAHTVLGRMAEARENPVQKVFLESAPLMNLDAALRDWAAESVDLCGLLKNLEVYETYRSPYIARQVAEQRQSLRWSPRESDQLVAKEIERHYRNANVRLAISDDLMNRFLPKPQILEDAVNGTIVGASVSGSSRTLNRLQLRLIPDARKIRMGLEAHGVVHSNTGSSSGPVTVYSRGEASYVARKLLLVSQTGLHVWPAVCEANAASNTQDIDTDYDAIPVLRTFVRKMAETQRDELYGEAMGEVAGRVRATARRRLDEEADPRIEKMGKVYEQKVQGPLERLDLKPTPISMSTTEDRAIIRFRVAGDSQLGAHTPRPCAPSDSVASIQVHESVLNNVADQLMLNGQTFTLPELHRMVAEKLGLKIAEPADLPVDAQVTFAEKDAVVIRCDDGKIWVTLSVAELTQGRNTFRNFKATALYHLISHGLHTELERDGVVRLQGKRLNFREQIALRGVTAKLFSQNRKPQVIASERAKDPHLAGLSVSQLVVLDGWIGLAIAPTRLVRNPNDTNTSTNR